MKLDWYEILASGDVRRCQFCGRTCAYTENEELCFVCLECGAIDRSSRDFDMRAPYQHYDAFAKKPFKIRRCEDPRKRQSFGRYKEKFHLNERISQWKCQDPLIPAADWARIQQAAESGVYGPKEDLTRASVITITRDLGLQKYRERWKSVLRKLNPDSVEPPMLDQEDIAYLSVMFGKFVEVFRGLRAQMPKSIARKKGTEARPKDRHNFISYNYVIRKELEMLGIWDHHDEFPVPRSHAKLHALDDIMEKMVNELKTSISVSSFCRSTVIKRPKLKRKV